MPLELEDTSLGFAVKKADIVRASKQLASDASDVLNTSSLERPVRAAVRELAQMFPDTVRQVLQELNA